MLPASLRTMAPASNTARFAPARLSARSLIPLLALAAAACSSPRDTRPDGAERADRRRPEQPVAASRVIDGDAPLDVRLLRIEPVLHVGHERVCDVLVAGQPQEV